MQNLKIAIGCDHGGLNLKNELIKYLIANNIEYKDFGTFTQDSCDYPVVAKEVCGAVNSNEFNRGILTCGTGIGMSIMANKTKGIRAAVVENTFSAQATRAHNDTNVLCLGERVLGVGLATDIMKIWLETQYEGGRHQKRVDMFE